MASTRWLTSLYWLLCICEQGNLPVYVDCFVCVNVFLWFFGYRFRGFKELEIDIVATWILVKKIFAIFTVETFACVKVSDFFFHCGEVVCILRLFDCILQQTVWLFFKDMILAMLLMVVLGPPIVSAIIYLVQVLLHFLLPYVLRPASSSHFVVQVCDENVWLHVPC